MFSEEDFQLLFPDDYINSVTERLKLYTELNKLETGEELQKFELGLKDRFGELPAQAVDLLNSMRLKWIASQIGLEKILMKKGKFVGYFVSDQESKFYQGPVFGKVLQFVQTHPKLSQVKEKKTRNGLRLLLVFEGISSVDKALGILERIVN